jgi:hypothetical protein
MKKLAGQKKKDLAKKHARVLRTPASFAFYVAIHDFVECVEAVPAPDRRGLPSKYSHLKEVYQGLEDKYIETDEDLGHDRYMAIQDLNRIQEEKVSDANPLWKRREILRTVAGEVFEQLGA